MAKRAMTAIAAAAALVTLGNADYTIDPNSVPLSTRQSWCANEISTCPKICQQIGPGTTIVNRCDSRTLSYECLCGNNQRPNLTEYSLSLPFFICQEWGNQCIDACTNDYCSSDCREKHPCGATDPKRYNATSSASANAGATASRTENPTMVFTENPGDGSKQKTGGAGATAKVGRAYGLALTLAAFFAGFALV